MNRLVLEKGRCVHKQIAESRCKSDLFVGNNMVDMFAKMWEHGGCLDNV
jgi:hypothetical protein